MAGEKIIEKPEAVAPGSKSDSSIKLTEKDLISKKDGKVSDSLSSLGAVTGIKGEIDQPPIAEQGAYYPPASYCDYYYPGYNGAFNQLDDQGYFNAGIQSDNGSLLYYLPGYNPYSAGFVGGDGKQSYLSSGYLQQPVSYGSESLPCYTWGSTYCADTNSAAPKSGNVKSTFGRNGSDKSNGFNSTKTNSSFASKNSAVLFNPKTRQSTAASNLPKSNHQAHRNISTVMCRPRIEWQLHDSHYTLSIPLLKHHTEHLDFDKGNVALKTLYEVQNFGSLLKTCLCATRDVGTSEIVQAAVVLRDPIKLKNCFSCLNAELGQEQKLILISISHPVSSHKRLSIS